LEDEWQKLSARHSELVRVFNGGQPALQEGESLQNPQYKRRTADMQTQIERMARDLLALKRELSRHTSNLASVPSK
jgi:CII-binding regulator of phage lambda lysogenization HflD